MSQTYGGLTLEALNAILNDVANGDFLEVRLNMDELFAVLEDLVAAVSA